MVNGLRLLVDKQTERLKAKQAALIPDPPRDRIRSALGVSAIGIMLLLGQIVASSKTLSEQGPHRDALVEAAFVVGVSHEQAAVANPETQSAQIVVANRNFKDNAPS